MSHIMICDPHPSPDAVRIVGALAAEGYLVESFSDGSILLEASIASPPQLVVYALGPDLEGDMAVLRLLRRAHPAVALVVLTGALSLETRSVLQSLRPTFCSVGPPDAIEVLEVVHATLRPRERKP